MKSRTIPTLLTAVFFALVFPALPIAADTGYTLPPGTALEAAAYGNDIYVAIGYTPTRLTSEILDSPDGKSWVVRSLHKDTCLLDIAYGNGVFVAIGRQHTKPQDKGIIMISWTKNKMDETYYFRSITYGNNVFAATESKGGILASPDGETWTLRETGAKTSFAAVSYCNDKFVALGDDGAVSTSPDGITWTNCKSSYEAKFIVGRDSYVLNGETYPTDAAPFIKNGRIFVPVRYMGDAMGVETIWDDNSRTVRLVTMTKNENIEVDLAIGSNTITYNEKNVTMDVAPLIRNGRVYLPARYVTEALGHTVAWDEKTRAVTIK